MAHLGNDPHRHANRELRDAYLARLGLDVEPPSLEALVRIHRAQVERIAYEVLWIHTGDWWDIDVDGSVARIARQGRGGYCLHLNPALGWLLRTLGYEVTVHVGGVHGPGGANEEALSNHVVLTVAGLPTEANPGGRWYVDAGLGDGLHEPLPLVAGTHQQGPFTYVLSETPGEVGDWHLRHDPKCAFVGMAWRAAPTQMSVFARRHHQMSTSPESGFVRVLTVQRRDATGVDVLRGLTLARIGDQTDQTTLESEEELVYAIGDVFDLDVAALGRSRRRDLWVKTHDAHLEWIAAGRP